MTNNGTEQEKEQDKIRLKIKALPSDDHFWKIAFNPAQLKKGITGKGSRCFVEIAGLVLWVKPLRDWLSAAFIGGNKRSNIRNAEPAIFTVTYDGEPFQEIGDFFPGRAPKDNTGSIHDREHFGAHLAIFYKQDGVTVRGRFKHTPEQERDHKFPVYQVEFV